MSRGKKKRDDQSHDAHARERPASTDVADLEEVDDASHDASDQQRRRPTAGPSEDDRWGAGEVAYDRAGRIINVSVVGGRNKVTIALGEKQGVHVGMEGYLKKGAGMAAAFSIESVAERTSTAFVDLPIDVIQQHLQVVVNPATMPKAESKHDMKARVVSISVEGGQTKIMIGFGSNHGARHGMKGQLLSESGGVWRTFTIAEEHPDFSVAYIDDTVDAVRAHTTVRLNPE
jgi:hypothetical protein